MRSLPPPGEREETVRQTKAYGRRAESLQVANTIRAFAPKLVARRRGRIIVLSSMQGKHGAKDASSYSASKWGILGLMKSAALELGEYNITVNALIPGLVDTQLTRYEKRLTESMGETEQKPSSPPTPQPW